MDKTTVGRGWGSVGTGLALLVLAGLLAACGPAFITPDVTPGLSAVYAEQNPDAQQGDLERGRELFMSSCDRCHRLPAPASHSVEKWPGIMKRMGRNAALNDVEEQDVLRFILAVREL